MAIIRTPKPSPLLILLLTTILISTSSSLPIPIPIPTPTHTLLSLTHSLLTRVSTLRASRGDIPGSLRAKTMAQKVHKHTTGLGLYTTMWSVGWDYVRNYAWRDLGTVDMFGVVSDLSEVMKCVNEVMKLESEAERVKWVGRNYGKLVKVFKSSLDRLLKVFTQSGPLKDAVEMVRTEIVDGGLLQDCLELGGSDLKGVIQILKDLALHYSSTSQKSEL